MARKSSRVNRTRQDTTTEDNVMHNKIRQDPNTRKDTTPKRQDLASSLARWEERYGPRSPGKRRETLTR